MCTQYYFVYATNNKILRQMRGLTNTRFLARPQLENFEIFGEVFISRTTVLYRKFITDSANTSTLNVFNFDKVDNSP
jgi:hypothetical protein